MDPPASRLTLEQRFQLFLDSACDYAMFFMDPNGAINEWSAGAEKILGYSETEALQLNGEVIFTPEDLEDGVPLREMETAVREGQANDERWHERKDRTRFFAVGRLIALKDAKGELFGYAKILRDATQHRVLEEALQASDAQFRATFAQAPLGMALADLQGRIQQANAAFCLLVGRRAEDVVGQELISFTAPHDLAEEKRALQELFAGERASFVLEKRLVRADDSHVWVQNSAALLRDKEDRPLNVIDLCQDISVLKLTEAELGQLVDDRTAALVEKTKQLESFCYTIAHDLRAPLRAISGYAGSLQEDFSDALPAEGAGYIDRIRSSAKRLEILINDLLNYTRVQELASQQEEVDLTDVARDVVDQLKRENPDAGAVIDLITPLGRVLANTPTVEHVLLNLLTNAVKFRREGVVPVVRIYAEDRGDRRRLWVEDNGIGIDPRFKERVFGMFERLPTEPAVPGTGVGLAIVAAAMERLGGARGVEQNHPHGSRFWVEFPLA